MAEVTMTCEALECHLAAIEDRISKTATILVLAADYNDDEIDGQTAFMVKEAMQIADEQLAAALAALAELKTEAGIVQEDGHA